MDSTQNSRPPLLDGYSYGVNCVASGKSRYMVAFSGDTAPITVVCPRPLQVCHDAEKIHDMGSPIFRNHKLVHRAWGRGHSIPGFPNVHVSLLRYYEAENGTFLSCIFNNLPGLPGINVEIVYHCLTSPQHNVVFGTELDYDSH
jgi:hypothetical protein